MIYDAAMRPGIALGTILTALAVGWGPARPARADGGKARTVKVAEVRAFMMSAPRRFARTVAVVHAGDEVTLGAQVKGADWFAVTFQGKRGYLPLQALAEGAYGLRAGSGRGAQKTTGSSVQLAARAFGPEVETKYQGEHPAVDYQLVDAMEAAVPTPAEVSRFAAAGGVSLGAKK
jgi:hypothetical protein